jgi:flagellar biosynthesis protein FlhB
VSGPATEAPTPRRLAEARGRGEVACSRELTGAVALGAGLLALTAGGASLFGALAGLVRSGLRSALEPATSPSGALLDAAAAVARCCALPMLAAAAAGMAVGLLQTGGLFAPSAAAPRLDRLDPARGLAGLLSRERFASVGLGLAKAALVLTVAWSWARGVAPALGSLPLAATLVPSLPALLGALALRLSLVLLALGAADLLLVRWRHLRRLRMTRQEVRREQRDDEGDPRHREARRRRHRALLEAGPVARATCVLVNPTHVAVALRHRRGEDEPPRVVAKGLGAQARRIRSAARRAGVPVVRDVALARALHRLAEVGDEIPESLYEAAAGVLAHLYAGPPERIP